LLAAVPALRRAVELSPASGALRNDLAAALNRVHRYREAREILERLIAEQGEQVPYLCNLCNALVSLGLQREGAAVATRATEIAPEQQLPWRTLGNALVYLDGSASPALEAASRQAAATLARPAAISVQRPTEPERRLRVGLLSAALRTHPVGWLTIEGFEALDPAGFELVCFGQPPSDDALQRRFQAASSEWHVATRRAPADVADLIRAQSIDVLIELGGWGDLGMLGVCAARPAPVQIKWVGMQSHSTGLPEIDWMITDRWETPAGVEHRYSERLLRLPDGYVCYSPSPLAPDVAALPAHRNGYVTFGCFNNLAKMTPAVVACWAAILRRVPSARLVLKAHQYSDRATCESVRAALTGHAVESSRLELRGSSTHRAQLLQHGGVDIMLDPFPYSGGLVTCESLWMGVPVIAMPGETFASRHSTSHLCNVGLPDWVAADVAGYQDMAVQRAGDLTALAALRGGLRARMKASPLCDGRRFGRNLGNALRDAWRKACAA
jgi:protein O-GlcNAc transferase